MRYFAVQTHYNGDDNSALLHLCWMNILWNDDLDQTARTFVVIAVCVVSTSLNVLVVFDTVVSCLNLTPMSLLVVALILDEQRVRLFYCVRARIGQCYCLAFGSVLGRTLITCMRYYAVQTRCNGNDDSALMFVGMHYFGVQIHYNQWRWRLLVDVSWMICWMYGTAIVLARSTQTNSAYVCIAVSVCVCLHLK